ncbi:MAG: hypothetical protein ACYCO3_03575 [Mycobacteriales bacterium]
MGELSGKMTALLTAVALVFLGAPVGLAWALLSPAPLVVITSSGAQFAHPEADTFFASDGYFLLIGLVVGALCGLVALGLRGLQPVGALVGLTLGGIGAALVAAHVGTRLHRRAFIAALTHAQPGTYLHAFVTVRADGAYFAWPFAAVVVYGVAAALRD